LPCLALRAEAHSALQEQFSRHDFQVRFAVWYSIALANKLSGNDLNGSTPEIRAQFQLSAWLPLVVSRPARRYLGLDVTTVPAFDLVTVLLHELAHGLGFQTFTALTTGAPSLWPSQCLRQVSFDDSTNKTWVQMTRCRTRLLAINSGNLVWMVPRSLLIVPNVLGGTPRLRVNSPPSIARTIRWVQQTWSCFVFSRNNRQRRSVFAPDGCSSFVKRCKRIGQDCLHLTGALAYFTVKVENAQKLALRRLLLGM